ncbi:unnamed protein product [Schistosoma turkestanicum]|nr:unnamed protein product [Schistosoma turkestanicum]
MSKDFDFQDVNASPEIPRGKSDNNDSLFRDSYQFPISPDIKNSTLNANDGVNISDVSQLKFSPIYCPSYDSSLINSNDFNLLDFSDASYENHSSLLDKSDETTCHNILKLKAIPEVSISQVSKSEESFNRSLENLTSITENDEMKKWYSSDTQKQVTPNLLLRTKNFMKMHHSCIDVPPAHWISAPVALTPNRDLVHRCSSIENEVCFLVSQVQSSDFFTSAQYTPKCYTKSFTEINKPHSFLNFEDNGSSAVGEVRMWIKKIIDNS